MKFKIGKKLRLFGFFSFMSIKIFMSGILIGLLMLYVYPISYNVMGFRLSYVIILAILFIMYKYWERFIKRKLHFILVGNNRI